MADINKERSSGTSLTDAAAWPEIQTVTPYGPHGFNTVPFYFA